MLDIWDRCKLHTCLKYNLSSVFIILQLSDDWQIDYESYKWTKLDPDSAETKLRLKEHFAWEGDFKPYGKKFNAGKVYKWLNELLKNKELLFICTAIVLVRNDQLSINGASKIKEKILIRVSVVLVLALIIRTPEQKVL